MRRPLVEQLRREGATIGSLVLLHLLSEGDAFVGHEPMSNDLLREEAETLYRLSKVPTRFCDLCGKWTDHFADTHEPDDPDSESEIADPSFVALQLVEARKKLGGK